MPLGKNERQKKTRSIKLYLTLADAAVAPLSGYSLRSKGFSAEAASVLPAALVQSSAPLPPDMVIVAWKGGRVIETRRVRKIQTHRKQIAYVSHLFVPQNKIKQN